MHGVGRVKSEISHLTFQKFLIGSRIYCYDKAICILYHQSVLSTCSQLITKVSNKRQKQDQGLAS